MTYSDTYYHAAAFRSAQGIILKSCSKGVSCPIRRSFGDAHTCSGRDASQACVPCRGANPSYYIFAGLVFTAVTVPYLRSEYGKEFEFDAPVKILDKLLHAMCAARKFYMLKFKQNTLPLKQNNVKILLIYKENIKHI